MINWSLKNMITSCLFFFLVNTSIVLADINGQKCIDFIKAQGFTREIRAVRSVSQDDRGTFYLVTFKEKGFVLVAASNGQYAVVGFSDNTDFDISKDNPLGKSLFKSEVEKVNRYSLRKVLADEEIPPLGTALFNQNAGWNALCPLDQGSRTLVGCVGTAMAIIMNYWKYPYFARGSSTYIHETINEISVNFDNYRYRWDLMSKDTPDSYNTALLYHCAAAVKSAFSVSGTTVINSGNITYALKNNFGYNTGLYASWKDLGNSEQWKLRIKEQLKKGKPVLYLGADGQEAHAFVIEGYHDGNFYVNWGWGGNSNGYFDIDFLYTPPHDFRKQNRAFFDIEPQALQAIEDVEGILKDNNVQLKWQPLQENAVLSHFVLPYRDVARYNSKGPQRVTAFNPATFGFASSVKVYGIGHSFYIDSTYPGDSTYKFILYKQNASEKIYESPTLKAVANSEMIHQITSPVIVVDSFYAAIASSGSDSLPPSYASMVEKDVCHSQYGEPNAWTKFNYTAPGGRELHTYVYVTGTRAKGHFPKGGYIITRNGAAIDTVTSLEECNFTDNAPLAGKNIYCVIAFKDTTAYTSAPSDSVTVQNNTVSTIMKKALSECKFEKNVFTLNIVERVKVQIEAFAVNGCRLAIIKDEVMTTGMHNVPVQGIVNGLPGFLIIRAKIGDRCVYMSVAGGIK